MLKYKRERPKETARLAKENGGKVQPLGIRLQCYTHALRIKDLQAVKN